MKRLILILPLLSVFALAQGSGYNAYQTVTFSATGANQSAFENGLVKYHQLIWTTSGTVSTCTVALDTSADGISFSAGGAIAGQTCTSNGSSSITGIVTANYVRINLTALSGGGSVTIVYEGWAYNPSGGGGGSTCGTPTCTVSTAGSGNGVLALSGNTSGTATFTAPAVAGTPANAVTASNFLSLPVSTFAASPSPSLYFGANTGTGLFFDTANDIGLFNGNTGGFLVISGTTAQFQSGAIVGWSSATTTGSATDTALSRSAAGVVAFGNGSAGNESGLVRWNTCKVTADITLPVNTATTVCTWSLPAVAKAWGWQCQIPWVISAGTGTNTLAVIANASQTPTGTTNGSAEIKTTNTNTATEATTAISASGATTLLTSGTITPAATVFMSSTSGTLLASATAGTFAIQMTAAGTTATAAAKAGATCVLY